MYVINIHGIIGEKQSETDNTNYFTLGMLMSELIKAKDHNDLMLDVASNGGYHDIEIKMEALLLASKKTLHSRNSGNVISAASRMFMLAPFENRTIDLAKGQVIIHNPWTSDIEGDSEYLAAVSRELKDIQNDYVKLYSKQTGIDSTIIEAVMRENRALTREEVINLRIGNIQQANVIAFAKLKSNKKDMENEKIHVEFKSLGTKIENLIQLITKKKVKALMISSGDGIEFEFPEINDESEIAEGTKILQNGAPFTGTAIFNSGLTVVAENGVVMTVTVANDDATALKAEIEALKAELVETKAIKESVEARAIEVEKTVTEVQAQLQLFKKEHGAIMAKFSDGAPQTGNTPTTTTTGETIRTAFKKK